MMKNSSFLKFLLHPSRTCWGAVGVLLSFCVVQNARAAAVVARQQQLKAQEQQVAQQAAVQQEQQQIAAYQQAMAQQQVAQYQQAVAQQQVAQYQQAINQRNQAIAQAVVDARQQAVQKAEQDAAYNAAVTQAQNVQIAVAQAVVQKRQAEEAAAAQTIVAGAVQQREVEMAAGRQAILESEAANAVREHDVAAGMEKPYENVPASEVKEVVDLSEVWKKLDEKSTVWTLLIDNQAKVATVAEYISRFQKQGVKIQQAPPYYAHMIDQMVSQNPQMLNMPFPQLLEMAAIVDYDFDDGTDKDALARKVLGEQGFEANKKRLGR